MVNFRGSLIAITAGRHPENCSTCFPASVNAANYFYHFLLFAFIIVAHHITRCSNLDFCFANFHCIFQTQEQPGSPHSIFSNLQKSLNCGQIYLRNAWISQHYPFYSHLNKHFMFHPYKNCSFDFRFSLQEFTDKNQCGAHLCANY